MARRAATENVLQLNRTVTTGLALEPGQTEKVWWDSGVAGLGYRLRGTRATWVVRPPRAGGKSSLITLGAADALDVTAARTLARARIGAVAKGEDPRADRRREKPVQAPTMGEIFARYTADAEARMRPSTFANLKTHTQKHFVSIHAKPLPELTRADVATLIRTISRDSGAQSALRARRTLSTIFVWAIGEGLTETSPVVGTNPPAQEIRRDRVLSRDELVAVWNACPPIDDFGRIVRLLILTGQRRDEIAALRWSEVDLERAVISLPAPRTKNARPHAVPLGPTAINILAGTPRIDGRDLVFGSRGPFSGFSKAKARLDERSQVRDWRIHDLRRSTATGMGEIGVPPHHIEHVLNHVSGYRSGVAGVYQRQTYAKEMRDAIMRWDEAIQEFTRPRQAVA